MGCGCPFSRRDAPPSSRRGLGEATPGSYRFAVAAVLVRGYGLGAPEAERLVQRWRRLVETRRLAERSPASTAEHVRRFEAQKLVAPYPEGDPRRPRRGCPVGTEIQTLILPRDRFTPKAARAWARRAGFHVRKIDVTERSIRIRQRQPTMFREGSFRTITLDAARGVKAVIGCPR